MRFLPCISIVEGSKAQASAVGILTAASADRSSIAAATAAPSRRLAAPLLAHLMIMIHLQKHYRCTVKLWLVDHELRSTHMGVCRAGHRTHPAYYTRRSNPAESDQSSHPTSQGLKLIVKSYSRAYRMTTAYSATKGNNYLIIS